jgi:hypothetical protein
LSTLLLMLLTEQIKVYIIQNINRANGALYMGGGRDARGTIQG